MSLMIFACGDSMKVKALQLTSNHRALLRGHILIQHAYRDLYIVKFIRLVLHRSSFTIRKRTIGKMHILEGN